MANGLESIFKQISSSNDVEERSFLREELVKELNNINGIANEMSAKQAKTFLGGLSFEINKAHFIYGVESELSPIPIYLHSPQKINY